MTNPLTVSAATPSRIPASSATASPGGLSGPSTERDQWPTEATSGMRTAAAAASSPSASVLHPASATAAPVSSHVACTGSRRAASGPANGASNAGSTSGR